MLLNQDKIKHAKELMFPKKELKSDNDPLLFNNVPVYWIPV